MNKKVGPGESLLRNPGPGEQQSGTDGDELDVEGHTIGDVLTRPIDGLTGQPKTGHDGLVRMPGTGGEDIPDFGPDGTHRR